MAFEPHFLQAASLPDARDAKRRNPDARFLGGGTTVIVDQNLGRFEPHGYISLRKIPELRHIEAGSESCFVGAATTLSTLLSDERFSAFSALRLAARVTGSMQIRSRSTLGGNVLSRCTDRNLSCCLLALGARLHLYGEGGNRAVGLSDDSGQACQPGEAEILVGVEVPAFEGWQCFTRLARQSGGGKSLAAVALYIDPRARTIRLGISGGGNRARRVREAEEFAETRIDWNRPRVEESLAEEFAGIVARNIDPPEDVLSTSSYRRHAIRVMSRRILQRAGEEMG